MTVDARKERFELVEVLGHPMLFTCLRVDRSTVPKGLIPTTPTGLVHIIYFPGMEAIPFLCRR